MNAQVYRWSLVVSDIAHSGHATLLSHRKLTIFWMVLTGYFPTSQIELIIQPIATVSPIDKANKTMHDQPMSLQKRMIICIHLSFCNMSILHECCPAINGASSHSPSSWDVIIYIRKLATDGLRNPFACRMVLKDYGYQINGLSNRTTLADGNTWNHATGQTRAVGVRFVVWSSGVPRVVAVDLMFPCGFKHVVVFPHFPLNRRSVS